MILTRYDFLKKKELESEFQTTVSCVAVSGNETKEIELGTLNVMHEPENVKISRNPDKITCSAEFSKYDEVTASLVSFKLLSIQDNLFVEYKQKRGGKNAR